MAETSCKFDSCRPYQNQGVNMVDPSRKSMYVWELSDDEIDAIAAAEPSPEAEELNELMN